MKSNVTRILRLLSRLALGLTLLTGVASAQQASNGDKSKDSNAKSSDAGSTVKPTPESAGDYTIISSIEFGYRGIRLGGDEDKYKSDLNYKAGPRLFDSSFLMRSKEGTTGLFEHFLVTSTGWGADPNGQLRINVEQPKWYRFDGSYRRFKYFRNLNNFANPSWAFSGFPVAANPANGLHGYNTRTEFGDFDLTLLPKNEKIKFYVGYSPERYDGPAFTTYHSGGNEFQLLSQLRSRANDWRVGADAKVGPFDLSFLQGFRRFRDDSFIDAGFTPGINPNPTVADFTSYDRNDPIRGSINYTRFSAHTFLADRLDITARLVYSSATTNSNFVETFSAINYNPSGAPTSLQRPNIVNFGNYNFTPESKRPNTLGDLGVTYLATDKLRISNTFRVETFQINGSDIFNSLFVITKGATRTTVPNNQGLSNFEITKYRKYQDILEGDYQFNNRGAVHFGYRYGNRHLEQLNGGFTLGNLTPPTLPLANGSNSACFSGQAAGGVCLNGDEEEDNHTHAFFGGFKARPYKNWSLFFDAEHGTADNVFTRIGNYDYTNFRAKSRYTPTKRLSFFLAAIIRNNSNPGEIAGVSLEDFGVSVKSKVFSSSVDWTPNSRFSMNAGYTYTWSNSNAVINYDFAGVAHDFANSLYFVRNNFFFFDTVTELHRRATLYMSYRINKDNGQGNRVSNPTGKPGTLVTSYPMSFQGPEARLAFKINRRLDWNVGYQYYNYNESALVGPLPQNYHAHLPYTSLRIYFGRGE
jgi:hypothetical protein